MSDARTSDQKIWLIEEVPGVPADEAWFVAGGPFKYDHTSGGYPHFSTRQQAEDFLRNQGVTDWSVELLIDEFL